MEQAPTGTPPNEEDTEDTTWEDYQEQPRSGLRQWLAPAWFLLGVLVGVVGLALFTRFSPQAGTSPAAIRAAARDGTLDAIATLSAGGGQQQPSGNESQPTPNAIAFSTREANRLGNKNAKVTLIEFSDFQ